MSFTRSTTQTNVHQSMPDYPSSEGILAAQLKQAFDAPAEGLQTDVNNLMTELESSTAATSIGADPIYDSDTSGNNVQAKLEQLQAELEDAQLGGIIDNSITQVKMNSTYENTIAKKDNTLQTGLNAEKVGGMTLAELTTAITSRTSALDQNQSIALTSTSTTYQKTFTAASRYLLFVFRYKAFDTQGTSTESCIALYDCRNNMFLLTIFNKDGSDAYFHLWRTTFDFGPSTSSGGSTAPTSTVKLQSTSYSSGTVTMNILGKNSDGKTLYIKCITLDGLLP